MDPSSWLTKEKERGHQPFPSLVTGTFVLVVVALLIMAVVWPGRGQRWFKGNVSLRIELPGTGGAGILHGSEE